MLLTRASRRAFWFGGMLAVAASCSTETEPRLPAGLGTYASPLVVTRSAGGLSYRLFVPSSYAAGRPAPLVLMLHGCTQSNEQFAAATQMDALAEANGFLVAYPDQPTSAQILKCWRWFEPAHQARGGGEPAALVAVVDNVAGSYTVDRERVYTAGFSAGAGMAVVLGATYPDVFSAIAVGSGLEYRAGTDGGSASAAMRSGGPNPKTQGELAYRAMGAARRVVPVLVVHGSADTTVAPVNADQIISQWAETDDLAADGKSDDNVDDRADATETKTAPGGRRYTRSSYSDRNTSEVLLEKVLIDGMNHAWSGPGSGAYTDSRGPSESELVWQFFRRYAKSGPIPPDGGAPDAGIVDAGSPPDLATPRDLATPHDLSTPGDGSAAVDAATADAGLPGVELVSIDREDGTVGALPVDAATTAILKAGDKGLFGGDQLRGILSFDTSALPSGRTPKSAQLVLTRKSAQGTVSALSFDVKRGSFGAGPELKNEDFSAAATVDSAASAAPPASDGATLSVPFSGSALAAFTAGAPGSRVQIRIRAATPRDFNSDSVTLFDGAGATQAPRLILTY